MPRPDSSEMDLTVYKDKDATPLHKHFAAWIVDKTGYDPNAAKSKSQAFLDAIRLGAQLRMAHQASPENQAFRVERAQAIADAQVERAARITEKAPKKDGTDEAKPTPARRATKKAVAALPDSPVAPPETDAKPAPRRRAAKAAGAAAAPF